MNLTRISLYRHELEIIANLTVELTRLRQNKCEHLMIENVGPEIFAKLTDALYKNPSSKLYSGRVDDDMFLEPGKLHNAPL